MICASIFTTGMARAAPLRPSGHLPQMGQRNEYNFYDKFSGPI
jgi:hypothetical protein